jgi:hypothetical protein
MLQKVLEYMFLFSRVCLVVPMFNDGVRLLVSEFFPFSHVSRACELAFEFILICI